MLKSSDVEDVISLELYLKLFNSAYKKKLNDIEIKESDLPPGERIVDRINRFLDSKSIQLKASGGYNHYLVANCLTSNPPAKVDTETLNRFEQLLQSVIRLYSD